MLTAHTAQPVSGTLVTWGRNDFGQAAAPPGLTNVVNMSVGLSHSLALTDDGVLMGWPTFWATPGYDHVVALAAGQSQSLVLDSNGTVTDLNGPSVPAGLTNVSAISANAGYSLALRGDGTVVAWGLGWNNIEFLTLNPPADLTNAVAIAAGQAHGVALRRDGKVVTWGDNTYGQTNMPATLTNVVAITANQYKSLALTADGTLISWGQVAPPPAKSNVVAIASGAFHDIALLGDGSIIGWGGDSYGVLQVPSGLTNAIAIAAGGWNNVALANNGNFSFASRQPQAQTIYSGSRFTLKAAIAGFPVSTYQWRFNGTNLAGATQGTLVLSNITPTSTGDYSVVVSNLHGSFISGNVALTVMTSPPLVTSQSSDQIFAPGTNALLYVSAGGSLPIQYQWRLNGTNIVGATNSGLIFPNLQVTNRGAYDVVLSNTYGTTTSTSVRLHVLDLDESLNATNLTWITSGDAAWFSQGTQTHGDLAAARSGVVVSNNQQSVLQTMVTGPATLSFWWRIDAASGNDHLVISVDGMEQARISGSTGWEQQTVYLGAGPQTLQWVYTKLDSWDGAGWLDQVSVQYESTPPFITLNPTNLVVIVGSNATLNAAALGTPPLSLQWQFNQTNLDDATNASLTLADVQFPHEGSYVLGVSNAFGATNTMAINLNVVDFTEALNATNLTWSSGGNSLWWPQTAVSHDGVAALQSGSIAASQQSTVQTTVTGPGAVSFWWKISSETNNDFASFSVDGVEQARISGTVNWQQKTLYLMPGGHSLTWNYSKNATLNRGSDAAWLDQIDYVEGTTPAFIFVQPVDQVASLLSNATFSATAQGTPPLSFQWFFNDDPVAGATNAILILASVQATNAGNYRVFVTNDYGSALSSNAQLHFVNVYAWGAGRSNTLSPPTYGQSMVPLSLTNALALAAGGFHSLALRPGGKVTAWGWNTSGQTNVPSHLTNALALAAGMRHSLALRSNGTMTAWGDPIYSQTTVPASGTNVMAIGAGWHHNLALKSNGTVIAWGAGTTRSTSPNLGQSIVPAGLSNVVAIAGGGYHSLALKRDGTVTAWGWNVSGQTNVPGFLSNVVAIAAGGSNSLALRSDGTVIGWGNNTYGQSSVPAGLSNVVGISAGAAHNLALRDDGTLVAWGLNGSGQTNAPVGLTNFMALAAGGYHSLGLVNLGPPGFLNQPLSQTVFKGNSVAFKLAVLGAPPLNYQWQFNSADIPNETNRTLVISDAQLTDTGGYRLSVSNTFGAVTSSVAMLEVRDNLPFFLVQPASQFVVLNSNAVFNVSAAGAPPLYYQWRLQGTNLAGKTSPTLLIPKAQLTNDGNYSVVVSNAQGVVTSSNAFLNVIDLGEALDAPDLVWTSTTNPPWLPQTNVTHDGIAAASSGIVDFYRPSTLQTTVSGPGTLTFWWRSSGFGSSYDFSVDGVSQGLLNTASVWQQKQFYLATGTRYLQWRCSVSSPASSATHWLDQVSYVPGPTPALISNSLTDRTVPAGTNVTFAITAGGTPPLSFQWQFGGANIAGATGSSLTLNNVQATHTGSYSIVVSNAYGVTNRSCLLVVNAAAPFILSHPESQEMVRGGAHTFTVSARGTDPLNYQWQFNHADLPAATNASLVLTQIQTNDAGNYRVIVSNAYGTNTSTDAALVIVPTVIVGWGHVFMSSPRPPPGLTNVAAISAGDNFSVALKNDGTVSAWGWDAFSRLNVPAGLSNVSVISAGGFHTSALLSNSTVVNWGDVFFDASVNVPAGLSNVVDIAAGYRFNLGLRHDGTVTAWGDNFMNPLNLPSGLSNVVEIAAGYYHGLALGCDGTVAAWGNNSSKQANVPVSLSNVVAVAAGQFFSAALTSEGSVVTWGSGSGSSLAAPAGLDGVMTIAAGAQHCLALKQDGTVVVWGSNSSGQTNAPSWLTNVVAIAGGSSHSLALLNDGSPYITRQPWSQTLLSGVTVTLNVAVMGLPPFSYQWHWNGTNITGATNATLILTNVPLTAAGEYRCLVSNTIGTALTLPAALTVLRSAPHFVDSQSGFQGDGNFRLELAGLSGHGPIIIFASTNLMDWQPILTNPPAIGLLRVVDSAAAHWSQRFYRAEEQ